MRSVHCKGERIDFEPLDITTHELRDRLSRHPSDFARDLANRRFWTPVQEDWAHYLVWESEQPPLYSFPKTAQLVASVKLQRAAIVLSIFGVEVAVRKRRDGYASIFVDGTWVAALQPDGAVRKKLDERVCATLAAAELDPVGMAALHGQLTGCCCFCRSPLTTAESVTVGYGPVCAERWGLPWGRRDVTVQDAWREAVESTAGQPGS